MSTVAPVAGRPRRRSSSALLAAMLVVASLAVAFLAPAEPALAAPAWTTTDLNLRTGPGLDYEVILVMEPGAYVEIVQNKQNGYYRVRYNGISGWAALQYLDRNGPPGDGDGDGGGGGGSAVVTEDLNLRSGPSTGDRVLAVMPAGAEVTLRGDSSNGFLAVRYNGTNGWAYAEWLDTDGGGSPDPSPDPGSGTGETATVTEGLNLRSSPWGSVITVMPAGAAVELTGESSDGFLGVIYDGTAGWAHSDYLDTSGGGDPGGGGEVATVTSALNLRSGPSTGDRVLAVMPGGAAVEVTGGAENGFYPVVYNGTSGWAYGDYLDFDGGGNPSPDPGGGGSIIWPFSGGEWTIIQGYNGGTHNGSQYYYSLDMARTDGNTAGQTIYAPVSGTVLWNDVNSGGLLIDMGNGYGFAMFHVTFDGGLGRGDWVNQGDVLGSISYPGGPGYAVTPHVDLTLWDISGGGRQSAPFTGANALSGQEFWETGGFNQHGGTLIYP